ncbi:hypothetical protein PanWU01x14_237180 [Parasponia andersonii]|uniref:Uncharacterized protein n=1 Tax=Parasponia andersonii TaxID=3476 RepID=A0A2P5BHZ9_PARAD|nr:hypothetical protein PanWU01x14_237180 [Parasponia andersonii]
MQPPLSPPFMLPPCFTLATPCFEEIGAFRL